MTVSRLKTLLAAAGMASSVRRKAPACKVETHQPIRRPAPETKPENIDPWLFDSPQALPCATSALSAQIDRLSDALSDVREMLCLITGEAPHHERADAVPVHARLFMDRDLFDGEAPALVTRLHAGEEAGFLFEDEFAPASPPSRKPTQTPPHHAQAA